jgi:signal transduction histidine kinase
VPHKNAPRVPVLTVDDSPEDLKLNRMILEGAGYPVACAETYSEAKKLLGKHYYGVLVIDLRLPDGNGIDLLSWARKRDPHVVAIVLTGFTSEKSAVAALKAGAYDFLTKPCPKETLEAAVARAAERYALTRTLADRNKQLENVNHNLDSRVQDATQEIFDLNEKLKRTIEELKQTNKSQTRALEEVAHELKNPLSVIWGYTSFWAQRPKAEYIYEDIQRCFVNVERNAQHLQALIDDLLDSARLGSGKVRLRKEDFPAEEAVREVVEAHQLRAADKKISLKAECIVQPANVAHADRVRLRQILANLISNAIKFTPAGGCITVRCRPDIGATHFIVEDTGKGMQPADAEKIFTRFYQVKDKDLGNKGLGLGLAIVEGLVRLHGGNIWVDTEPGHGARFHVVLPTAEPVAPKKPTPAGEEPTVTASAN